MPDVRAYTFHAVLQAVPADVLKGRPVGLLCQFNAGNAALFFPGAEQQPKGSAAGTEVQNTGISGQFRKPAQEHAVRAQREAAFRYIQGKAIQKCFQVVFLILKTGLRRTQAGGFRRISLPR